MAHKWEFEPHMGRRVNPYEAKEDGYLESTRNTGWAPTNDDKVVLFLQIIVVHSPHLAWECMGGYVWCTRARPSTKYR